MLVAVDEDHIVALAVIDVIVKRADLTAGLILNLDSGPVSKKAS